MGEKLKKYETPAIYDIQEMTSVRKFFSHTMRHGRVNIDAFLTFAEMRGDPHRPINGKRRLSGVEKDLFYKSFEEFFETDPDKTRHQQAVWLKATFGEFELKPTEEDLEDDAFDVDFSEVPGIIRAGADDFLTYLREQHILSRMYVRKVQTEEDALGFVLSYFERLSNTAPEDELYRAYTITFGLEPKPENIPVLASYLKKGIVKDDVSAEYYNQLMYDFGLDWALPRYTDGTDHLDYVHDDNEIFDKYAHLKDGIFAIALAQFKLDDEMTKKVIYLVEHRGKVDNAKSDKLLDADEFSRLNPEYLIFLAIERQLMNVGEDADDVRTDLLIYPHNQFYGTIGELCADTRVQDVLGYLSPYVIKAGENPAKQANEVTELFNAILSEHGLKLAITSSDAIPSFLANRVNNTSELPDLSSVLAKNDEVKNKEKETDTTTVEPEAPVAEPMPEPVPEPEEPQVTIPELKVPKFLTDVAEEKRSESDPDPDLTIMDLDDDKKVDKPNGKEGLKHFKHHR